MNALVLELEDGLGLHTFGKPLTARLFYRSLLRTLIVGATALVAVFVPYFAQFMTLVGALCLVMIVFILPVVFYWKLREVTLPEKLWGALICAAGALGGGIGCVQAIHEIADKLSRGDSE